MSGVVPIIMGENLVHRKIFNHRSYVEALDGSLSLGQLESSIASSQEYIAGCKYEDLFTPQFIEYLSFLRAADFLRYYNE